MLQARRRQGFFDEWIHSDQQNQVSPTTFSVGDASQWLSSLLNIPLERSDRVYIQEQLFRSVVNEHFGYKYDPDKWQSESLDEELYKLAQEREVLPSAISASSAPVVPVAVNNSDAVVAGVKDRSSSGGGGDIWSGRDTGRGRGGRGRGRGRGWGRSFRDRGHYNPQSYAHDNNAQAYYNDNKSFSQRRYYRGSRRGSRGRGYGGYRSFTRYFHNPGVNPRINPTMSELVGMAAHDPNVSHHLDAIRSYFAPRKVAATSVSENALGNVISESPSSSSVSSSSGLSALHSN